MVCPTAGLFHELPVCDHTSTNKIVRDTQRRGHVVYRIRGRGVGLVGSVGGAAVTLGAHRVTLKDREPLALHCAMASAACKNGLGPPIIVNGDILDWSTDDDDNSNNDDDDNGLNPNTNLIVASDVLYDAETIEAFAKVCRRLLAPGGVVLVADPLEERFQGAREPAHQVTRRLFLK